jgi:hypothetical protein
VETDTLTPEFEGGFYDPGDTINAVEIQVRRKSDSVSMWNSGTLAESANPWDQNYAGSALSWAVTYQYRIRVRDSNNVWSSYTSYTDWTTVQPVGPDNLTPRVTTVKANTLTPTLTVGHLANQFRNEEITVRSVASDSGGTTLWTKTWQGSDYANTNSVGRTYAGTALNWGQTYYWKARIEDTTGGISAWSGYKPLRINALPTVPTELQALRVDGSVLVSPSGIFLVDTLTPVLAFQFNDPDLNGAPGDAASNGDLQVERDSDSTSFYSISNNSGMNDGLVTYAGTTLVADTVYRFRVRIKDNSGQYSDWSPWTKFKRTSSPTVTITGDVADNAITVSDPVVEWTFSGSAGKTQISYRVEVWEMVEESPGVWIQSGRVYDSTTIFSGADEHTVPTGYLENGKRYGFMVSAADTDGLLG